MKIVIVINKKICTKTKIHFHGLNHLTFLAPLNSFFKAILEGFRFALPLKNKVACLFYKRCFFIKRQMLVTFRELLL